MKEIKINKDTIDNGLLREQIHAYQLLANETETIIYSYSSKLGGIFFSSNTKTILGFSSNELLKDYKLWLNSIDPKYQKQILSKIGKLKKDKIAEFEYPFLKSDGKTVWVKDRIICTKKTKDEYVIQGFATDISNSKLKEEKLRKSVSNYEILFNRGIDGILIGDMSGKLLDANNSILELTGFSKEYLIGKNISILFPKEELNRKPLQYKKLIKEKEFTSERYIQTKNKKIIPIEMKSKILDDDKLISFIRDISDRKLATEILEKSELTYRSLINEVIDSSSVAIFILDSEFKVVWINKSTEKFFGVTKSETKGKVKADLIRNTISKIFENPQEFEEKVISTYKNNTYTESFECHVLPKGKRKERWLFHWSQPITSGMYKGGRIEHYTDITEQKIVKTELEKSKAELESIYRFSPAMTCILDDKRNVLYANKAFTNFTGTTEEELKLGKACGVIGCINSFDDARGCGFGNGCADCKLRLALDETLKTGKTLLNIEYNPIILKDGIKKHVYFIGSSALLKFGENRQLILTLHDITEQKEFEETLKKFENIVASTQDAVSLLDKNYKYLIVNKSYEKFSGQKKAQIIGKSVEDYLGKKAFNEKVKPNFDKCLNGETISYQDYFEYPTLGKRFVEVTYFPYRNSLDEIDGIIANTKDITEKKIIEESLKESENRFKNMANTAPVLIWMSDENKLCNYFNDVWLNFTGKTMEQELGYGWAEGVHKEDFDYCLEIYNKNFDARKEFKMEYRLKHYDGSYKWIFDHGVPRFSEDGNFIGYIGSGIDIQDKKEKEDALKIQSEILQNMAEGSSLVRVSDGTIVFANPSFEKMFGYEKGELLGKHISNLNAPTDQSPEEIAKEIIEDLTKNKIWKGEVKNIRKDGSIFWSYATVSTFNHNLYGEVWATAQSDVTAKKNLGAIQIKEKKRLEILHDLYSKAKNMSDNEMYDFVIEKAVELTDSRIGFFHELSDDQKTIKLTAWSSETIKECTAVVNDHYPINQAGNWIESIKQKKPLIYNNFITSPNQKGLPEGHSTINRMMSVPVMYENKVKYIFGVGNKGTNYDENDTLQVQLVADELQKILATRKANEEILKSNERLKEAERIGNIGYFYFEVPNGIVIWSDEVFRIIERDIKLGVPTIEEYNKYIDPEYLKNFNAEIEEILSKKTSFDFIYKINAPSKDKFIQSVGKVHLNEKGEVCALSGVIKDITDYQLALLSSKENEEKFETAFKTSPDAIAITRIKDGTYIDINNSFKRILGYDREEMIGKSSIKLNIWRYEKDRQRLIKALKENGYVENLDAEYLTKNGEIIYGLMSARLIKFGGEDVILSITRDITQRTNIAKALKESEIKHRKLISKISDVIAVINSERKITYKSSNIEEYFGWKPEELIGKEALFTCHPKDYERIDNELIKLIQNRNYQVRLEFDYRCKDGSYKPIELTAINLTEDPIIKGVVVNYKDISERKKAEKIVVETQRLGAIGEMSSAIAHDFNNSLQSIFGNLELALLNLDKNHASRIFRNHKSCNLRCGYKS